MVHPPIDSRKRLHRSFLFCFTVLFFVILLHWYKRHMWPSWHKIGAMSHLSCFCHVLDFSKFPFDAGKLTPCDLEPQWREIGTVFGKNPHVFPPKAITSLVFDQAKQSLGRWTLWRRDLFLLPTHIPIVNWLNLRSLTLLFRKKKPPSFS